MLNLISSCLAAAWGDEAHEVVALIAQTRLDPALRRKVSALFAADTDPLAAHTITAGGDLAGVRLALVLNKARRPDHAPEMGAN